MSTLGLPIHGVVVVGDGVDPMTDSVGWGVGDTGTGVGDTGTGVLEIPHDWPGMYDVMVGVISLSPLKLNSRYWSLAKLPFQSSFLRKYVFLSVDELTNLADHTWNWY